MISNHRNLYETIIQLFKSILNNQTQKFEPNKDVFYQLNNHTIKTKQSHKLQRNNHTIEPQKAFEIYTNYHKLPNPRIYTIVLKPMNLYLFAIESIKQHRINTILFVEFRQNPKKKFEIRSDLKNKPCFFLLLGRFSKVLERIGSRRIGTEANRCGLSFGGGSGDQTTTEAATSPTEIKRSPTPVKERRRKVGFRFEEMDLEIKASPSPSPSPSSF